MPNENQVVPDTGSGEAAKPDYDTLLKNYTELETKLGKQDEELGHYKEFADNAYPILEKLGFNSDDSDALAEAVTEGKINHEILKSVLEGKVTTSEATQVTQAATKEVKQEAKNVSMTQEEIDALVSAKVAEAVKQMDSRVTGLQDELNFEKEVKEFIDKTADFEEHMEDIDKWLDDHNSTDLRAAYYAVKGELSEKEALKKAAEDAAEEAKKLAQNAAGGQGSSGGKVELPGSSFHDFVAQSSSANDL